MPRVPASLLSVSLLLAMFGGAMFGGPVATGSAETGTSADQALELAKKTGRPIFAAAGSET